MNRTYLILLTTCLMSMLSAFGCDPARYEASPDAVPGAASGTSDEQTVTDPDSELGVKVDIGDGVDVQVDDRVNVQVDKDGVDVDVKSADDDLRK